VLRTWRSAIARATAVHAPRGTETTRHQTWGAEEVIGGKRKVKNAEPAEKPIAAGVAVKYGQVEKKRKRGGSVGGETQKAPSLRKPKTGARQDIESALSFKHAKERGRKEEGTKRGYNIVHNADGVGDWASTSKNGLYQYFSSNGGKKTGSRTPRITTLPE